MSPVNIHISYCKKIGTSSMYKARPLIFAGGNTFVDSKYHMRFTRDEKGSYRVAASKPCLEWLPWIIQVALLKNNAFFVHAAALSRNGKTILFPAWSGAGKTSLSSMLVKEYGMEILGEDFVILSNEGKCYSFPIPMVLHSYHKELISEAFELRKSPLIPQIMLKYTSRFAGLIKKIVGPMPSVLQFLRRHNLQSVKLAPSEVFGKERIGSTGKLNKVIWLEKVYGLDEIIIERIDQKLVTRIFGCTISDWDFWCTHVIMAAIGVGVFDVESIFIKWIEMLAEALTNSDNYILYIPEKGIDANNAPIIADILALKGIL